MPMTLEQLAEMLLQAALKAKAIYGDEDAERVKIIKGLQDEPGFAAFFHEFGQLYGAVITTDLRREIETLRQQLEEAHDEMRVQGERADG